MLKSLGNSAYSYTFTDISSGFFNKAEHIFTDSGASGEISFKTLDVEKDITEQGFIEHSYDLIVASLVLHATQDLEATMRNVRRLLRPGGFLVLLEITNNTQTRFGFIFGSLSGWWRSIDGRLHSPCVDVSRWQEILSTTGFSGVDTVASSDNPLAYPFSVIVSQAVTEDIVLLREPLRVLSHPSSDLTILGDFSLQTSVANKLEKILAPYYSHVNTIPVMPIGDSACKSQDIIVDTQALNSVLQHDIKSYISSLGRLFASTSVKKILWITNKHASGDACTGLSIGIAKSLQLQHQHIVLLCLDIEVIDDSTVAIAAIEALNLKENRTQQQSDGRLWSREYDVQVVQGQKLIPRLVPDVTRADRHRPRSRLFRPDFIYWIVGLTPEYTISICEWMIENGAKFILVLSSQKCEESQIERLRSNAALIECYDM
jgi:hybrid polyketide synthase/nonribosomal peptide synthetase ACE1